MSEEKDNNIYKKSFEKKETKEINQIEDDTNFLEKTKQEIEGKQSKDEKESEEISANEEAQLEELSEEDIEKAKDNKKLKKLLKILFRLIKKQKKKKEKSNATNFQNNDLAPSLGNEGLSNSSLSKAEKKKKLLSTIMDLFVSSKALKDLKINDVQKSSEDISPPPSPTINQVDLTKKINADLINDIGNDGTTKGPLSAIADSRIKGGESQGRGR